MPMDEASAIDHALFADTVTVELPLRLAVLDGPLPAGAIEQAERLLQWIAAVEDRRGDEGEGASTPALRRIETKLDVLLHLLARALPGPDALPLQPVRIGPRGLRLEAAAAGGEHAMLHWQPSDALPVGLKLPLRRLGSDGRTWAFDAPGPLLEEALERQVFRLHRRWRAQQRST